MTTHDVTIFLALAAGGKCPVHKIYEGIPTPTQLETHIGLCEVCAGTWEKVLSTKRGCVAAAKLASEDL